MAVTGRERFEAAFARQRPDHLPCQVHNWMRYYRQTYLGGRDEYESYEYFGMDPVVYCSPRYEFSPHDLANWQVQTQELGTDAGGNRNWGTRIVTPGGELTSRHSSNCFTGWTTEFLIKSQHDFELWDKYVPLPAACDWAPVRAAKQRVGDRGIVRANPMDFGQGSPWQSFCTLYDVEPAIMAAIDQPQWMHHVLESMLRKKLRIIEVAGRYEGDLIETGGGAGSNTVISPAMHQEFCLPYDRRQHEALHAAGARIVYHLCGGLMKMLDLVMQNGADGLETMTPPSMGGDVDMAEAYRRGHDKLFFIGGLDQNAGFERGTPAQVESQVRLLHESCPDGGYICCPSDHFFFGDVANLRAFVDACRRCTYN